MWLRIVSLAGGALAVAALASWQAQRRWDGATEGLRAELAAGTRAAPLGRVRPADLDDLPVPVARYLRDVLPADAPIPRRVRVTWRGEFNMGSPGADAWKPFTAVQDYVVDAAGFVWDARIALAPGVPVLVRDAFVQGRGTMRGTIAGLRTVVAREGTPDLARAALQRHLGEALWFPAALLPTAGVAWTAIDDARALATLSSGGVTTAVEFRFGPDGRPTEAFVADRTYDDGRSAPTRHPWRARNESWGEIGGVQVPTHAVAEWLLPGGPWAYWRGGPTGIETFE